MGSCQCRRFAESDFPIAIRSFVEKTGRNTGIATNSVASIRSSMSYFFFPTLVMSFPLFRAWCTFSTVSHTRAVSLNVVAKMRTAVVFVLSALYSKGTRCCNHLKPPPELCLWRVWARLGIRVSLSLSLLFSLFLAAPRVPYPITPLEQIYRVRVSSLRTLCYSDETNVSNGTFILTAVRLSVEFVSIMRSNWRDLALRSNG